MSSGTLPNYIMFYKCELRLNGISYDATKDLRNWEDIETAVNRSSLSGTVRSFISKFDFVGVIREIIEEAFLADGLDNDIIVTIYVQNNSWLWNDVFSAKADLSTLSQTDTVVSFSCIDDSIDAQLKAKKSAKFEYLVSSMPTMQLNFNRLQMNNYEEFVIATEHVTSSADSSECVRFRSGWNTVPLYFTNNSVPVPGSLEFVDEQWNVYEPSNKSENRITDIPPVDSFICRSVGRSVVRMRFFLHIDIPANYTPPALGLYVFNDQGKWVSTIEEVVAVNSNSQIELDIDREIILAAGQRIVCMVRINYAMSGESSNAAYLFSSPDKYKYYSKHGVGDFTFRADWEDIGQPVSFDCIRPVDLLQSMLDSICGPNKAIGAISDDNPDVTKCVLAAGESIRDFSEAKIYSSFTNFCNFMETVFGYVYQVVGNEVRFVHRDSLFLSSMSEIDDVNNVELSIDNSLLYSAIEIGQERVEYGEENGIYEINFKQSFTTGHVFGDNVLKMVSGYRVDAYGVEYLVEHRNEDKKDNSSDNSVFAIHTLGYGPVTSPDTSVIVTRDGEQIRGYFNTAYHPRKCIEANRSYLATFAKELSYASSDGNTELSAGFTLTDNVPLADSRRYTPCQLKFSTSNLNSIDDINGMVKIHSRGKEFYGWISKFSQRYTRQNATSYTIIVNAGCIG